MIDNVIGTDESNRLVHWVLQISRLQAWLNSAFSFS